MSLKFWLCLGVSLGLFYSPIANGLTVKEVSTRLNRPWAVVAGPQSSVFVTEKSGRIKVFKDDKFSHQIRNLPTNIRNRGQGGLLDLAFHPQHNLNQWVYLAYATDSPQGPRTRISRFRMSGDELLDPLDLLDGPAGRDSAHFGCRLLFDADQMLYATFGERHQRQKSQSLDSLHGKIVRLKDDGSIPTDNPFVGREQARTEIFSFGHRNPQGIDIHPVTRELFVSEHGPSGYDGPGGGDEINRLVAGGNFGWPIIHHDMSQPGMISPLLEWTPAIAPSGIAFYKSQRFSEWENNLFVAALRGRALLRLEISDRGTPSVSEVLLRNRYGRIRDVATGPEGFLWVISDHGHLLKVSP